MPFNPVDVELEIWQLAPADFASRVPVLALYNPISHRSLVLQVGIHPHVNSQALLGNALFCLGFPHRALAASNAAIAEALEPDADT